MTVLVTGASGFVGSAVVRRLAADGDRVLAAHRRAERARDEIPGVRAVQVPSLDERAGWGEALVDVKVVVHAAARVHVMRDRASDPLAEFRRVNVAGTLALARQAAAAGVRRFVFVSSIKVNGERTAPDRPFTSRDAPAPVDPYGISKHEAEQGLRDVARETGLEVAIVRPVLVYGAGVKGNFRSMLQWLQRGLPLPLGAVHNRRSLVALDNLVDLLAVLARHPAAAGRTFLVSDGEDLSTTALLRRAARALGRPPRLLPVPAALLRAAARASGRGAVAGRLLDSLTVDTSDTRRVLGWTPPVAVDRALADTARHLLAEGS